MDLEKFEEIEGEIMDIVERVGVVKADLVAKQLDIKVEDAGEVLEALRHRRDLAKSGDSYHKRKSRW